MSFSPKLVWGKLHAIPPPFDPESFDELNKQMLNLYGKAKHKNSWDISIEDEQDEGDSFISLLFSVFIIISFD